MTEALLIASESISVLAAPEALLIVFHSLTSFIWGPLRPTLSLNRSDHDSLQHVGALHKWRPRPSQRQGGLKAS